MSANGYRIEPIESAPFAEVSYLIWLEGATDALVVDPGFEPDAILSTARREGLRIVAILNTHGHVDHIAGNAEMKRAFPNAPLVIGRNEASLLGDPELNLSQRLVAASKALPPTSFSMRETRIRPAVSPSRSSKSQGIVPARSSIFASSSPPPSRSRETFSSPGASAGPTWGAIPSSSWTGSRASFCLFPPIP